MFSGVAMALAAVLLLVIAARRADPRARPHEASQIQITFDGDATNLGVSPDGKTLAHQSGAHLHLMDVRGREDRVIPGIDLSIASSVSWLPDSSAFDVDTGLGNVYRVARDGGKLQAVSSPSGPRVYSPDGTEFAYAARGAIRIVRDAQVVREIPMTEDTITLVVADWSRDGQSLLVEMDKDEESTLWNLSPRGDSRLLVARESAQHNIIHARYARRHDGVLYARKQSSATVELVFVPLTDGRPSGQLQRVVGAHEAYVPFSITGDDKTMAYTRFQLPRKLWTVTLSGANAADPMPRARLLLADFVPKVLCGISPDSTQIAYLGLDGQMGTLFVVSLMGGTPRRLLRGEWESLSAAWSPDSQTLAFVDGDGISAVSARDGHERHISLSGIAFNSISWAPQSKIYFLTDTGVSTYDPDSGQSRVLVEHSVAGIPVWSRNRDRFVMRKDRDDALHVRGVWVMSADGSHERLLAGVAYHPLGWSADDRWIIAATLERRMPAAISNSIVRIPIAGGPPQPWFTLPIDEPIDQCKMSEDTQTFVCTSGIASDVWLIDNMDELLSSK